MLLTTKLAEILGAKTGDTVTVEVLEGARPMRQVSVAGTVDEMIGLAAYIDISTLNRMMREGPSISGAYLSVDSEKLPALYSELKRTPAVAGVAVREAMLESFYNTIAESLRISTTTLNLFACLIAVGMVYNSARVALSERGHELASLRVLGFNQREISFMLLGRTRVACIGFDAGRIFGRLWFLRGVDTGDADRTVPHATRDKRQYLRACGTDRRSRLPGNRGPALPPTEPAGSCRRAQNEGMTWLKSDCGGI